MTWSILPAQSAFADYETSWDQLNQTLFNSHPLFDSRYIKPLLKYFADEKVKLAVQDSGGKINGMCLLTPKHGGWRSFLPAQLQISPILVDTHVNLQPLFSALPGLTTSLDLLAQDVGYTSLLESQHVHCDVLLHGLTMNIEFTGTFEEYWQKRSKKLRDNLRRRLKKPKQEDLELQLRLVSNPGSIEAAIRRYSKLEINGWKGREGTAVVYDSKQGQFYREVLCNFSSDQNDTGNNKGFIYELYLDDQLCASRLNLANDFMLINLKKTYNEDFADYAPGRLMDYLLIEHEFKAKKYRVLEYNTNAKLQDLSWATNRREISHFSLYPNKLTHTSYHTYYKLKNYLTKPTPTK